MLGCRANLRCALGECNWFVFHMWANQDPRNASITSVACITCFVSMWSNPPVLSLYCVPTMLYAKHLFSSTVSGQDRQEPILRGRNVQKAEFTFQGTTKSLLLGTTTMSFIFVHTCKLIFIPYTNLLSQFNWFIILLANRFGVFGVGLQCNTMFPS